MQTEIPLWPVRLTRQEQSEAKDRANRFAAETKARFRAARWRFASGSAFQQIGDWFVSVDAHLTWKTGCVVRAVVKPMSLDPLFWDIVGLPENRKLPLSFRTNGAWVLRPTFAEAHLGPAESSPEVLAGPAVEWAEVLRARVPNLTLDDIIGVLDHGRPAIGSDRAALVCLRLLATDTVGALAAIDETDECDAGGFSFSTLDGSSTNFLKAARCRIEASGDQ